MNFRRIALIFNRELRDQLRDRRTMFTIFGLPLLLYPFMGMLMLQVAQFQTEHKVRVEWVGAEHWDEDHPLDSIDSTKLIRWERASLDQVIENLNPNQKQRPESIESETLAYAKERVQSRQTDFVLITIPTSTVGEFSFRTV